MTDPRSNAVTPFPEELLSGYLDGALTQQEEQQVRVHLERSPEARRLLDQLAALRGASRSTSFAPAEDRQWSEAARTPATTVARRLGFALLATWLLAAVGIALYEASRQATSMTWWEATLLVTGVGGALLLFGSVLADRLRDLRVDRYRRVLK
jgi:predicted anti-sigma-YlaC factor YlaD